MKQRPRCTHGLNDSVELTFRMVSECFIDGVKTTTYGYRCKEHGRNGTYTNTETIKKGKFEELQPKADS